VSDEQKEREKGDGKGSKKLKGQKAAYDMERYRKKKFESTSSPDGKKQSKLM
jgi:hypothetical protein